MDGEDAGLTGSEFELLLLLASEPGKLVHRDAIGKTLRYGTVAERRRSTDMHICRIRRKLKAAGGDSLQIVTVYGRAICSSSSLSHTPARPGSPGRYRDPAWPALPCYAGRNAPTSVLLKSLPLKSRGSRSALAKA